MAAKTKSKSPAKKPAAKAKAKTVRRKRVVSTTRSALRPVDDSNRSLSNKNATKAQPVPGDASSITAHVEEFFGVTAKKFAANAGYGRQHINSNGAVHPDAVLTKSNIAVAKLAAQCLEVLAQRGSLAGQAGAVEALGDGGSPADAKKLIADISKFANGRVKAIQADTSKAILDDVAADLGIDATDLIPAQKSKSAKPAAKATATAKAS